MASALAFEQDVTWDALFAPHPCAFVVELAPGVTAGQHLGVTQRFVWNIAGEEIDLTPFEQAYEAKLEPIYPSRPPHEAAPTSCEPPRSSCRAGGAHGPRASRGPAC